MNIKTIEKLCCPFDKADLELNIINKDIGGKIHEGLLFCSSCRRFYPIVKGIPIMSPDEYREPKLEQFLLDKWKPSLKGTSVDHFRLIPAGNEENGRNN